MLALSIFDIVSSISHSLAPVLLPKETSTRALASGTEFTCSILGFFTQIAFGAVVYNGMLSFYYLLTVRYGVKRQTFVRRYELWMHLITWFYFFTTSSTGLVINLFSEMEITQGCWIGEYPQDCEAKGNCISTQVGWLYGGLPTLFTFLALPVNNLIIYFHVRHHLRKDSTDPAQQVRIQEVASQGFLYVISFYCCYTPAFIIRVLEGFGMNGEMESDIYPILVLNSMLLPLQGFLNMFIYARPNYKRMKAAYPEQSTWWLMKQACLESNIPRLASSRNFDSSQGTATMQGGSNHRKLGGGSNRNLGRIVTTLQSQSSIISSGVVGPTAGWSSSYLDPVEEEKSNQQDLSHDDDNLFTKHDKDTSYPITATTTSQAHENGLSQPRVPPMVQAYDDDDIEDTCEPMEHQQQHQQHEAKETQIVETVPASAIIDMTGNVVKLNHP